MFKLELELSIWFTPPMEEHGRGITLIQTIDIPFPPAPTLIITGNAFNPYCSSWEGYPLKDVTWDVDRKLFLANIRLGYQDHPISSLLDEIRNWIEAGWRLGSHDDQYEQPEDPDEPVRLEVQNRRGEVLDADMERERDDEDEDERLQSLSPRSRPQWFNSLFHALIREMALKNNNESIAYAMDKTQRFFTEGELKDRDSKPKEAFSKAVSDYSRLTVDEIIEWRERVTRKYPRLNRIVS